ncbi:hypothetical protein [Streptomyces sp. CS081A]|uniref:DUF6197 family protein n=1 Tax=Streptomyces sp. CS081A TaxID=2162709 RepID=UPI000D50D342|nr:hypothetical protein [Streptomyces sp. CS081A]PVC73482.1 hypothetical protein DBP18_14140 [Streptomyces sp. CS081A]
MAASTLAQPADPTVDVAGLIRDIEAYLAAHAPRTAHPLVTKTTAQLVAEALAEQPEQLDPAPALAPPSRALRILPDWALSLLGHRAGAGRYVTVAEHLELTALVIQRYGWTQRSLRTTSGRRCILGAQAVLYRLGYGDEQTAEEAGRRIQGVLGRRGISAPYWAWQDGPERTEVEVLHLIREAAHCQHPRVP